MAKKSSSGGALWLIVGAFVLIFMVPKEVWIGLGIIGAIVAGIYFYARMQPAKAAREAAHAVAKAEADRAPTLAELTARTSPQTRSISRPQPPAPSATREIQRPIPTRPSQPDRFYSSKSDGTTEPSYAIPPAPEGLGEGRWILPGQSVEVAGATLPDGMLYVGSRMRAPNGMIDPCLINALLPIDRGGDYRHSSMGYWPSFRDASPYERRAYLNWLASGRSDPECDIGYVFLFFYGLERRVIIDFNDDPNAKQDLPAIVAELHRLLAIYGERSYSFRRYAGELLSWIELHGVSGKLYDQPIPAFPKTYELAPYLRLALGQASLDRAPLSAPLALAWLKASPEVQLRTAATRCPDEFDRLFLQRYSDVLGTGLVLPKNRTKLKYVYQAASAGMRGAQITISFGDVPDVTVLTAPLRTLREIAEQCTDELGSYSRLVGKDPSAAESMEGLLLLPASLWPEEAQAKLASLRDRMHDGRLRLRLDELLDALHGTAQTPNRTFLRNFTRALEGAQLGMEPNVLTGARTPSIQDPVVLFTQPITDAGSGTSPAFQTAALTLQLAAAMAQTDGDFSQSEVDHLRGEVDGWNHLAPADRCRLHAHLEWLIASPPTLASLKRKLEPLPQTARETVAAFMVTLAQSDGFVSPDEIKFLEKIYKALGVEPKRVFSDVHAVGTGAPAPVPAQQSARDGFRLDADRIAALQEDTARVSALLSQIFTEEPTVEAPAPEPVEEEEAQAPSPLGLEEPYSTLVRLLLSRPEWTRAELEDAAADLDVMLDGALEHINEAAFDAFDEPLCEGDDLIEVHTDLLEKIEA